MKKSFLAAAFFMLAVLSIPSLACAPIYGWVYVDGGAPSGVSQIIVADMYVAVDVLHPTLGWLGYTGDYTDSGGFYAITPGGNGIYRARPVSLAAPYDGTLHFLSRNGPAPPSGYKSVVVEYDDCPNELSVGINFKYDYTNY